MRAEAANPARQPMSSRVRPAVRASWRRRPRTSRPAACSFAPKRCCRSAKRPRLRLFLPDGALLAMRARVAHMLTPSAARALGRHPGMGFELIGDETTSRLKLRAHIDSIRTEATSPGLTTTTQAIVVEPSPPLRARMGALPRVGRLQGHAVRQRDRCARGVHGVAARRGRVRRADGRHDRHRSRVRDVGSRVAVGRAAGAGRRRGRSRARSRRFVRACAITFRSRFSTRSS